MWIFKYFFLQTIKKFPRTSRELLKYFSRTFRAINMDCLKIFSKTIRGLLKIYFQGISKDFSRYFSLLIFFMDYQRIFKYIFSRALRATNLVIFFFKGYQSYKRRFGKYFFKDFKSTFKDIF